MHRQTVQIYIVMRDSEILKYNGVLNIWDNDNYHYAVRTLYVA